MPSTAPSRVVDLNADLGEGFGRWALGDDEALLGLITSANVACGFHAGDPTIMRRVCAAAVRRGVTIGAQVSYRDLAGFGRREMSVPVDDLAADVVYQIGGLDACARAEGSRVRYVKPHGALYNQAVREPGPARAIALAVRALDPSLPILTQPHGELARQAAALGLIVVAEAFPDRAYEPDGRLRARREPGAVMHDVDTIAARALSLAGQGRVDAHDGQPVAVRADSLCLHGDNADSVAAARAVVAALDAAGIQLRPFVAG